MILKLFANFCFAQTKYCYKGDRTKANGGLCSNPDAVWPLSDANDGTKGRR
jgi:hypothetical protein